MTESDSSIVMSGSITLQVDFQENRCNLAKRQSSLVEQRVSTSFQSSRVFRRPQTRKAVACGLPPWFCRDQLDLVLRVSFQHLDNSCSTWALLPTRDLALDRHQTDWCWKASMGFGRTLHHRDRQDKVCRIDGRSASFWCWRRPNCTRFGRMRSEVRPTPAAVHIGDGKTHHAKNTVQPDCNSSCECAWHRCRLVHKHKWAVDGMDPVWPSAIRDRGWGRLWTFCLGRCSLHSSIRPGFAKPYPGNSPRG